MPFALREVKDQRAALQALARLTRRGLGSPLVVTTARKIVQQCPSRDDECELQAIYDAVKHGHPAVKGLERGVRYVSDPLPVDFFSGPARLLRSCREGHCAEDCDGHSALVAALAGALGFRVGLRAWGPNAHEFEHVYSCVGFPKLNPPKSPLEWLGCDTTVEEAFVGWDPPKGKWLTAIVV